MPVNLGDIVFGLGPDTSRLRTAMRDILDFGDTVEQAAQAAQDLGDKSDVAFRKQEAAIVRAVQQLANYNAAIRNAGNTPNNMGLININNDAFKQFTDTMVKGAATPLEFQRALGLLNSTFQTTKRLTDEVAPSGGRLIGVLQSLATAASLTTGPLGGIAFRLTLLSHLMEQGQLNFALFVGGLVAFAAAAEHLTSSALKTEEGLLRMRLQLEAMSGSKVSAALDMKTVLDIAERFGVSFEDVAAHFSKLELAVRGSRMEGEKSVVTFQEMIAYASKFGATQQQLDAIFNTVTTSIERQRVQWRDVRGELTTAIPNAMQTAANAMTHGDMGAWETMLKRGLVIAQDFWPKFWAQAMKDNNIDFTQPMNNLFSSQGRFKNAMLDINNAFNQAMGLTDKYKSSLDYLTQALHFLSNNMDAVIRIAGALGGALIGAFLAPIIINNIAAITSAIIKLSIALYSLDIAALLAAAPLSLIFAVGGAILGGVVAYNALNAAISTNKDNLLGAIPSYEAYIKSIEASNQKNSERAKTELLAAQSSLVAAQAELAKAQAIATSQTAAAKAAQEGGTKVAEGWKDAIIKFLSKADTADEMGNSARLAIQGMTDVAMKAATDANQGVKDAQDRIDKASAAVTKLIKIYTDMKTAEDKNKGSTTAPSTWETRFDITMREFKLLRDESDRTFNAMQQGPKVLKDTLEQVELDKTIEQWKKKFQELGITGADAQTKLDSLRTSLTRLADAKKFDKEFMSLGQALEYSFDTMGKGAADKFFDALSAGKLKTMQFKDFALDAFTAIEKKIFELAVLNPIINSLFGSDRQGLSLQSKGTGTGGLIGSLLSSFGLGGGGRSATSVMGDFPAPPTGLHGGTGTAFYPNVNPSIFLGAPRLHTGLMPDEFPAILQDGETVIPKGRGGGYSGPAAIVNVHNYADSSSVRTQKRQQGGAEITDVIIETVNQGIAKKQMNKSLTTQLNVAQRGKVR